MQQYLTLFLFQGSQPIKVNGWDFSQSGNQILILVNVPLVYNLFYFILHLSGFVKWKFQSKYFIFCSLYVFVYCIFRYLNNYLSTYTFLYNRLTIQLPKIIFVFCHTIYNIYLAIYFFSKNLSIYLRVYLSINNLFI